MVALRWRPRRGLHAGRWLLCLTCLFPLAMALSDRFAVILAAALLHGFGLQLFDYFWQLTIQQQVPEDRLARVFAVDIAGSFLARPVGLALTGPVAAVVGERRWLLLVAVVLAAIELAALLSRDVRTLESRAVA